MFFDRFKKLCDEKGISTYKACTDIGLNRAAVAKWKNGSIPGGNTTSKLAEYFGVTTDYLLGNVSDPFFHLDNARILADINSYGDEKENSPTEPKLSEGEQMLINLFRQVPADQQELVLQMIRAALGKM